MTLYEATRDLHHACEAHAVGQRMTRGTVTAQEWADWLSAFRVIHAAVDPTLPPHFARDSYLARDLAQLPAPNMSRAAADFAGSLLSSTSGDSFAGAAYVLHGAHRRGGRVLAAKMKAIGLPTEHVVYEFPVAVEEWVRSARQRESLAPTARATFEALLAVMDEIEARAV
jgi:hypothetical protein